ncbi:protein PHTF2-like [Amphiura filiformis]|uniref:protein PHTF2-like n=1 Tax=Amphiura filiformis TaxID=82378 RepID=UPI003B211629
MGLNEAISTFQQKIGAYDKELWEEHVEEKELLGLGLNKVRMRTGRVKTELIDIDLVRGSTFTKAKPEHAWLACARKGFLRVVFFPLYYKWWKQQMATWMMCVSFTLYLLQILLITIYFLYVPENNNQAIYTSEVFTPLILMLILGTVYSQVVSTNVSHAKSARRVKRRRQLKQQLQQRKAKPNQKSSSSDADYQKSRSPPRRTNKCPAPVPPVDTTKLVNGISSRDRLTQPFIKPQIIIRDASPAKAKKKFVERTTLNGHAFTEEEESDSDQKGQDAKKYVPHKNGDVTTGCDDEVFTVLNTPIDAQEHAGEICVASQDVLVTTNSGTRVIQNGVDIDNNLEDLIQRTHHQNGTCNGDDKVCDNDNDDHKQVKGQNGGVRLNGCQPSVESEGYVSPRADMEPGKIIPPKVSLLERAKQFSPPQEGLSDNPIPMSDSEDTTEERDSQESGTNVRPRVLGTRKGRRTMYRGYSSNDSDVDILQDSVRKKLSESTHLLRPGDSDLDEPSWGETAVEASTSNSSSDSSSSETDDGGETEELSQFEDPFKMFPVAPVNSHTSTTSSEKIRVRMFEGDECKKTDMSVLEISCAINNKVHSLHASADYLILGVVFCISLAIIPILYRIRHIPPREYELSWLATVWLPEAVTALFTIKWQIQVALFISSIQRGALSLMFFFLLAVAERTYKQRCLFAKYFSHLTSSRRARKSMLPHFRLDKVRNIKAWLSLRSFLRKRGPQRSVNVVVSSAFLLTLMLVSILCTELLQKQSNFLVELYNWEVVAWTFCLSPFLLRFITLGSEINKKFRNTSVLLTEQINLYLHMERKPHKKDDLLLANNVLKLASKLLKELETPFKISGLAMNPVLYNITRVVVLSAFSGVLTELLGFKLKLWKIKT